MGDVYQRLLGTADRLDPGQWTKVGCGEFVDAKALVACAKCGGVDGLGDKHEIQRDGRVIPAWRCPTVTCSAVSWLWLEAWEP